MSENNIEKKEKSSFEDEIVYSLDAQYSLNKNLYFIAYYVISTIFVLSMIRFAIFLPKLMKSQTVKAFDPYRSIYNPELKQNVLLFSPYGILSWYVIIPFALFILVGIFVFSSKNRNLKKSWISIFTTTIFVVLGLCTGIFSLWRD